MIGLRRHFPLLQPPEVAVYMKTTTRSLKGGDPLFPVCELVGPVGRFHSRPTIAVETWLLGHWKQL